MLPLALLQRITERVRKGDPLDAVLRTLSEGAGLQRMALSLADHEAREIVIEVAHGLTRDELDRGRYAFGEGVIGEVVEQATAACIPSIRAEPRFLDRTGALDEGMDRSFTCVPLYLDNNVVGAISAYQRVTTADTLARTATLLTIVGGLLATPLQRLLTARGPEPVRRPDQPRLSVAGMIGRSGAMHDIFALIHQVADSPTTVLLTGESGTGKELAAAALHAQSARRRGPFVAVNCAALPEGVIESELFGHERGAFTGALQRRRGRFELAHGGTLFLDEIGDLSPATQIKLLRVLQERVFERLGGNETVAVDVRIVAATSRELEQMVAEGSFRADLYYRLAVFPIRLPPLRERGGDIVLLADHFVETSNRAHGRRVRRISTPAIDMLMSYHWPGNVRELENCIERAVLLARDDVLHSHQLPPSLQTADATGTRARSGLKQSLAVVERELIVEALKANRGNMAAAARELDITERMMGLRVKRHRIAPQRFKGGRAGTPETT